MPSPIQILVGLMACYVMFTFAQFVRKGKYARYLTVVRGWSPREWFSTLAFTLGELVVMMTVIVSLYVFGGPVMRFSWLNLIATPKDGPTPSTNLVAATTGLPIVGIVMFLALATIMPMLVRREEYSFRWFTKDWNDALRRSIRFGFVHMIVGVPVAAAIGLTISGLYFSHHYFQGGIRRSTWVHLMHNYLVMLLFVVGWLMGW